MERKIEIKKRGFTLIEIVMATIILSVVMLGLVSVFVSAKKIIRHSRARMTAAEVGKLFLEGIPWVNIQNKYYANQISTIGNDTYVASYTIEQLPDPMTNVYRIKTTIHWEEND